MTKNKHLPMIALCSLLLIFLCLFTACGDPPADESTEIPTLEDFTYDTDIDTDHVITEAELTAMNNLWLYEFGKKFAETPEEAMHRETDGDFLYENATKFAVGLNLIDNSAIYKYELLRGDMVKICLNALKTPLKDYKQYLSNDVKVTPLGTLTQTPNVSELDKDLFKVVTKQKPTVEQIEDAVFAWKLVKYVKSRGVVVSKGFKTTAIIQGVQNSALELALDYSCDTSKEAVVAVDGAITTHDLDVVAQGRVSAIILPFATQELVKLADKYQLVMITTGFTNYLD